MSAPTQSPPAPNRVTTERSTTPRPFDPNLEERGHHFLSHSDTEVLLHALEEWANDAWQRLNGMFAVALYDEGTGRLILARDRFGIKPLYYGLASDGLRFASEIKALLLDPALDQSRNPAAINAYFSLRYIPTPHTIFKSVAKLSPGTFLTVDARTRSAVSTSFAGMERRPKIPLTRDEWLHGLDDRLASAVSRQLAADVPGRSIPVRGIGFQQYRQLCESVGATLGQLSRSLCFAQLFGAGRRGAHGSTVGTAPSRVGDARSHSQISLNRPWVFSMSLSPMPLFSRRSSFVKKHGPT
jgi:hypothetical protein